MGLDVGLITDRKARSIKPGDKPFATGITGLWLHPSSVAGRGCWVFRFVSPVTGRRRDMGMGSFPDVSVAIALGNARIVREQLAAGCDPIIERDNVRAVPTFAEMARKHWAVIAPGFRNAKHRAQWLSSLEMHVFPTLGNRPIDRLTAGNFADVLNILAQRIPETAARIRMRCNTVMAAAKASGFITSSPMNDIGPLLAVLNSPVTHQPAMPWQAVPDFVREHLSGAVGAKAALLFTILTAARSGEARGMTWGEVNLDNRLWIVPPERMKAGVQHRVPLCDQALEVLQHQHRLTSGIGLVFPSLNGKMLSDMTLTAILRRANAPSDTPGRVATAHGFRASFRNWCADNDISSDTAERALAHVIPSRVQAAYERTDRLAARGVVMQSWGDFVTDNVSPDNQK